MPTYEYRCAECGETDEIEARMGWAPESIECLMCGGRMTRTFSGQHIQFRGEGFVITEERSRRGMHGEGSVIHGTGRYAGATRE